jgi:DNA-binding MarR family transcriptional regulator
MSYLKGSLCYAVHRARLSITTEVLGAFADQQITLIELMFLMVVAENPGISQADLAEALGVERPRIVPTLNKMEKRGLATRTVLATDSRFRQVQLTKSGQHMVRVLRKRLQEFQNALMARLDPTEARTIVSALWKIADKRPASAKQPVRAPRKS